jgi:HSP20 family protein
MAFESLVPWRRNTSLIGFDPFGAETISPFSSLQREMNRMFNNIWSAPSRMPRNTLLRPEAGTFFYPDIEMSETNGHIDLSAEIPGVSEQDIELTISQDGTSISLKGEKKLAKKKKKKKEKEEKDYYCAERVYGEFKRTVALPCAVDQNKVEAKFHDGVLEVKLTKTEVYPTVKHIPIKAG